MGPLALLSPIRFIRRKAMFDGVFGGSNFWRAVAMALFLRGLLKRFFGRNIDEIDIKSMGAGRAMSITTSTPLTRRQIKELRKSGDFITLAEQRSQALVWATDIADSRTTPRRYLRVRRKK